MKMPRHSRLLLVGILALGGSWIVQGQPAVDATEAKVDGVFTRRIQSDGPGAVCAVMKNGRLIGGHRGGVRDIQARPQDAQAAKKPEISSHNADVCF